MPVFPLKFRATGANEFIFADDAGAFFKSDEAFLDRYVLDEMNEADQAFLSRNGHSFRHFDDLAYNGFEYRWASRLYSPAELDYVILVPTLRCNLSCAYCQVSRVNEGTPGFDWTNETLDAVLRYLDTLTTNRVKIEFQGGEPLLRLDILSKVRDFCNIRFDHAEYVVCTNLQSVSEDAWSFLGLSDVFISTSLDANERTHQRQRTKSDGLTSQFFDNLRRTVDQFGNDKVSALPTIDISDPPSAASIIDTFTRFGIRSIYLRPINHQGFARKRFAARGALKAWNDYFSQFIVSATNAPPFLF